MSVSLYFTIVFVTFSIFLFESHAASVKFIHHEKEADVISKRQAIDSAVMRQFGDGECVVTNCPSSNIARPGILAESGGSVNSSPSNGVVYSCDGFVFQGSCNSRWYKVPNHCKVTLNCSTGSLSSSCNPLGGIFADPPAYVESRYSGISCPSGW